MRTRPVEREERDRVYLESVYKRGKRSENGNSNKLKTLREREWPVEEEREQLMDKERRGGDPSRLVPSCWPRQSCP